MGTFQSATGEFLTVRQVAAELQVSIGMVYKLMGDGRLGFTQIGRCRRIPKSAVLRLAAAGAVGCELVGAAN